jgi:hypothetical protein
MKRTLCTYCKRVSHTFNFKCTTCGHTKDDWNSNASSSRLKVKSHSNELLKEVDEYLNKYPKIESIEPDESAMEIIKKLKNEVEFLTRVIKNNPKN